MKAPPRSLSPSRFRTSGTVARVAPTKDAGGSAVYGVTVDEDNVPMTIQRASSAEQIRFGVAHAGLETMIAYLPARKADGTDRAVDVDHRISADGVTYQPSGAGEAFPDGILRVPVRVVK